MTTHNARINGDEAAAETYVIEMRRRKSGSMWAAGCRMLDRLSQRGGRWQIEQRVLVADWELSSPKGSFNPADGYLRSMRGTGDLLQLDARDQQGASSAK